MKDGHYGGNVRRVTSNILPPDPVVELIWAESLTTLKGSHPHPEPTDDISRVHLLPHLPQ